MAGAIALSMALARNGGLPGATANRLTERIRSLGYIANLVNAGSALSEVLDLIVTAVCQRSSWSSSAIMAADQSEGHSVLVARYDPLFVSRNRSPDRWTLSTSPIRSVLADRRPMVIDDAQADDSLPAYRQEAIERDYRTVVLLPFSTVDELGRGLVLSVHAHQKRSVDEEEIAFLETVALLASLAVERAHRRRLDAQQNERLQTSLDIHHIAMEQVLTSEDLGRFADLAARYLKLPFLLVDLTTNKLQAGGGAVSLPEVKQRDFFRVLARHVREAKLGQFDTMDHVAAVPGGGGHSHQAIIEPCIASGSVLGGIVLLTKGRPLEAAEALTALELRTALTILLLRRRIWFEARAETHSEYFSRLFAADWRDPAAMLARAQHLDIPLEEPARLAGMRLPPSSDGRDRLWNDITHAVNRELDRVLPGGTAFQDGSSLIIFMPERQSGRRGAVKVLDNALREVEWITQAKATACLGETCRQLDDYPPARHRVAALLGLAERMARTGIVDSQDFGPLGHLIALTDSDGLRGFVQETIGRIQQMERDTDGPWLETLHQYFAHNNRQQATADALGIHVTTLRYRLKRLSEQFALDLSDQDTRLTLEFALRIHRLLGSR